MTVSTITIDDQQIIDSLRELHDLTGNIAPILDEIGSLVQDSVLLNFREQHDPEGNDWLELSDATLAQRRKNGRGAEILRDRGILNRSITYNVSGQSVEIGTDEKYANMMQYGGKKADFPWLWGDIPERPFLGVSEADKREINALLLRKLAEAALR